MSKKRESSRPMSAEKIKKKSAGGRPFKKGQSGNPAGRPRGLRNKATRKVMAMLEAESDAITRSLIASAKQGDSTALRIIVDRLAPAPRTPAREPYDVGPLDSVGDCVNALRRIVVDVASGELPGDHADEIAARIKDQARIMESEEFERRIEILERAAGQQGRLQ